MPSVICEGKNEFCQAIEFLIRFSPNNQFYYTLQSHLSSLTHYVFPTERFLLSYLCFLVAEKFNVFLKIIKYIKQYVLFKREFFS